MTVRVQEEDFDVGAEFARFTEGRTDVGGVCLFTGLVRDMGPGSSMTLEHYPGMTERELARIEAAALARWPLRDSLIIHRFGKLAPGDRIVLVAAAAAHRDDAFQAARFLIDWLKTKAPFWKREETADGAEWVAAKDSDDDAAARWQLRED